MAHIVQTAAGRVQGTDFEGVLAFRTIPYAAPTGGANRFLPPQPLPRWSDVLDCTEFRGKAPQAGIAPPPRPELAEFSGKPDPSPETEDCLTLNVWTPSVDAAHRPVMVWFHGGAFSWGNANAPRVWGHRLAHKHDVVVVTVNQRLNIFGHLDLSAIGGEAYRHSGNAGTLDMVAALEWIRDNIVRFGGDPGNVTIFGESGGGAKVCVLLTMPRAVGLFHRGIVQSGAVVRLRTPERAQALTSHVMRQLGARSVVDLQAVPVSDLLAAIKPAEAALGTSPYPLFDRYAFGPVVDGDIVPAHPFDPAASSIQPDVPIIIGDMKQETASYLAPVDAVWNRTLTREQMLERLAPITGDQTGRVVELYDRLFPGLNPSEELIAITSDSNFRIRSWVVAQRRAALERGKVWMYSFEWETPVFDGRLGAPHAMDVPFTFNTLDLTNATGGAHEAEALSETMAALWCEFARIGRPEHPSVPTWPAYDVMERATLVLDRDCRIERDPRAEARLLWQEITGAA
ncbi:MAG TPA: carboxylesterase family protein [Rhodopila sp.]|uniref:carboxylesterase/lipase family protein n=1 Tax=Rhodopila sp. TaxID=2480087 RepID=UPI002B8ACE8E|nr:carboxylesterase family protein [Rhodopila sp.]HVY17527.1 carboxylesterase family protein [Rhodopila sp.]